MLEQGLSRGSVVSAPSDVIFTSLLTWPRTCLALLANHPYPFCTAQGEQAGLMLYAFDARNDSELTVAGVWTKMPEIGSVFALSLSLC